MINSRFMLELGSEATSRTLLRHRYPPDPPSYRPCRLRAPCRLMLTGMLNDLRGDDALRNMAPPLPAPSRSRSRWSTLCLEAGPVDGGPGTDWPRLLTWERPVVYRGSKVSVRAPSALLHVAMGTARR